MKPATDKLWIAITRPDRLPTALAAVQALEHRFPGGCYLLREYSVWWERAKWEPYRDRFASVHSFARIESCRGFGDLPRFFQQNKQRQRKLAALPIDSETDVILCLAGVLKIGNAVASAHRDLYKILCVPEKVYRQLTRPAVADGTASQHPVGGKTGWSSRWPVSSEPFTSNRGSIPAATESGSSASRKILARFTTRSS